MDAHAVDLHVHSNCSDGTLSPKELVELAVQKELKAFALTDHDTVSGLDEAVCYAESLKNTLPQNDAQSKQAAAGLSPAALCIPEVIPGIEFSTEYQGRDIHILGLYIDYHKKEFTEKLQSFLDSRILRNKKMCALLREAGIDISYGQLLEEFPGAVITRAHYAGFLLNHGYIKSISEAFERYVGDHCPCFVPREKVTPEEAIKLVLEADGIPVLAHPVLYRMSDRRLEELVAQLKQAGLMGIEAVYSTYSSGEERQMRSLARKYHLLITGGSDFHGSNKPKIDLGTGTGRLYVPKDLLEKLKKSRSNLLFTDMDGTLLSSDSTVSPAMRKALLHMAAAGHRLILTSGRPLPGILEVCRQIGLVGENDTPMLPELYIISNNGALIYDCVQRSPVLEYRICQEDIRYLVKKAKEAGLHIHGYTDREIVWSGTGTEDTSDTDIACEQPPENNELRFYRKRIHLPAKCIPDIADALADGSYKLQVIHLTDHAALERFRRSLLPWCGGRLQMIFSSGQYLEILPAEAGKGNALCFLTDYLPAMRSHTFAAGDAENDISMLQAAHTGIAMRNAAPAVKAAAGIVTKADNDHDGLLEILEKYFS